MVYFSLRGVSCLSGLRPTMIKLCITVIATHLKIIWLLECESLYRISVIYSWGHFSRPLMLFHYHLCCGVNTKIASLWLSLIAGLNRLELLQIQKLCHSCQTVTICRPAAHSSVPQLQSGLKTWLWFWFIVQVSTFRTFHSFFRKSECSSYFICFIAFISRVVWVILIYLICLCHRPLPKNSYYNEKLPKPRG